MSATHNPVSTVTEKRHPYCVPLFVNIMAAMAVFGLLPGCNRGPAPVPAKRIAVAPPAAAPNASQPTTEQSTTAESTSAADTPASDPASTEGTGEPQKQEPSDPAAKTESPAVEVEDPAPHEAAPVETATAAEDALPPFDRSLAVERIAVLTAGGPLLIDLVLSIDGRPFRSAQSAAIDDLILSADGDGDGQTTWAEAAESRRFSALAAEGANRSPAARLAEWQATYDRNKDDLVDRVEFTRLLGQMGTNRTPFQITESQADAAGGELWSALDTDSDGHLSADERAATPDTLKSYDTDDNDRLNQGEWQEYDPSMQFGQPTEYADDISGPPMTLWLADRVDWGTIHYALKERYQIDGRVTTESFPLVPGLAEALDADDSGTIERKEAQGLASVPAHVELAINFSHSSDTPAGLKLAALAEPFASAATVDGELRASASPLVLALAGQEVVASWGDLLPPPPTEETIRPQFDALDADKNGYLDDAEYAAAGENPQRPFAILDPDGNGMVPADEFIQLLLDEYYPMSGPVRVSVREEVAELFASLDAGGDNALSLREMRSGGERLAALDKDGDGLLALDEIGRRIAVAVERTSGAMAEGQVVNAPAQAVAPEASPEEGPAWFIHMDKNGDRDVSGREFLGPTEQFTRLDADADGLIDAKEAAAAQ